jgi:autotransporter-associated beta strand protein
MRLGVCARGVALAAVLALSSPARGQTYTWNQPAGGDWNTAANWLGGGFPATPGTVAVFGDVTSEANAVTFAAGATTGELRFSDVNLWSSSAVYTIGSPGQALTLSNGAAANLITVSGVTRTNQTVAANVTIGTAQPLTINNNGAPGVNTLTLTGTVDGSAAGTALNVAGWSNTTISGAIGANVGVLTKSGTGTLVLSGANAYTGGTVVNGGLVSVTNDNNLGAPGTGVTLNGGGLLFPQVVGSGRNITLGAGGGTILVPVGAPPSPTTLTGVISGGGGLTVDGGQYLTLQGSNTYTGPTVINNAGLTVNSALGGGTGRLVNTSSITINGYVGGQIGLLAIENGLVSDGNRVNDTAPITLNGGLVSFLPPLTSAATETVGNLTVRGFGTVYGNQIPGGFGTGTLAFGTLTRSDAFSTLYVGGPVAGASVAGSTVQVTFAGGVPTPGGSGVTIGIVPWIGGDRGGMTGTPPSPTGAPSGYAETLYTYTSNGLVALDPRAGTNFQQVGAGNALNGGSPTARHNALTGDPAAVASNVAVLSLVQNPNSTASSTINGTATLTVGTSTAVGAIANVNVLVFNGPTLNFFTNGTVNNTGYIYLGNEFFIADGVMAGTVGTSRITGAGGLVVSSDSDDARNTLYLINKINPNTFSGGLYLNGSARVAFDTADTQLGAPGGVISFRGGSLRYLGAAAVTLSTGGLDRPLQMTAAGGGLISVEDPAGVVTVPGLVSGPEQLTVTGPGTLVLANTANTYAGGTTVGDSTLVVGGPGSLGTGPVTFGTVIGAGTFSGGTLKFNSGGGLAANVNFAFPAAIDTNGNNVTLAGVVSGPGATFAKNGLGTLTLAGANTYAGDTVVNAGNLLVANTTGSGTGYGAVTVNPGAGFGGSGSVAGPVAVAAGGKLVVGTVAGPGTLTLHGATTLVSGSTFQVVLAGSTPGTGYSQLVVPAGGKLDLGGATLATTLSYSPPSTDKLYLVDNQNPVGVGLTGTFAGLPTDGSTVTLPGGGTAQISYHGDSGSFALSGGNDVVLYNFSSAAVPEPGSVLGLAVVALATAAGRRGRRAR